MGKGRIWFLALAVAAACVAMPRADAALPTPSWWNGTCDANHWNKAAASQGWKGAGAHALGASFRGVAVCGPGPTQGGAPDVQWTKPGWGEFEWECVELTMRFMSLAYGVSAYNANGNNVVRNYSTADGGNLVKINNGTRGKYPKPGDVISFDNTSDPAGHAGVVAASNVDTSGNGSIKMLTQNDTSDGWRTLNVHSWRVAPFGSFVPYGWLHHPSGTGGGTNHPPFGTAKAKALPGHGVEVRGWTIDRDTPTTATRVIVAISGRKPAPFTIKLRAVADDARPNVARKYPWAGPNHGFDLKTTLKRGQRVQIIVRAVDTSTGKRTTIKTLVLRVP